MSKEKHNPKLESRKSEELVETGKRVRHALFKYIDDMPAKECDKLTKESHDIFDKIMKNHKLLDASIIVVSMHDTLMMIHKKLIEITISDHPEILKESKKLHESGKCGCDD